MIGRLPWALPRPGVALWLAEAVGEVGEFGNPIAVTTIGLVHEEDPHDREGEVDQLLEADEQTPEAERQHGDKHTQHDIDHEPGDGKGDRLPRVEAHEFVLVVWFEVKKDNSR